MNELASFGDQVDLSTSERQPSVSLLPRYSGNDEGYFSLVHQVGLTEPLGKFSFLDAFQIEPQKHGKAEDKAESRDDPPCTTANGRCIAKMTPARRVIAIRLPTVCSS